MNTEKIAQQAVHEWQQGNKVGAVKALKNVSVENFIAHNNHFKEQGEASLTDSDVVALHSIKNTVTFLEDA